jgi:DNA polymerase-3 subunit epsilon
MSMGFVRAYNLRVQEAINHLKLMLPSFVVFDQGRTEDEQSCVWIENGKFHGMGYVSFHSDVNDFEMLKSALQPYPSNDYIVNLILSYAENNPEKKRSLIFETANQ